MKRVFLLFLVFLLVLIDIIAFSSPVYAKKNNSASNSDAKKSTRDVVMFGDDRFDSMKGSAGAGTNYHWVTQSGAGASWAASQISSIKSKYGDDTIIVYNFGLNDLNVSAHAQNLKKLRKKFKTVYLVEVGPDGGKDNQIKAFNSEMKKNLNGATSVQCFEWLKGLGASGSSYGSDINKKWFKKTKNKMGLGEKTSESGTGKTDIAQLVQDIEKVCPDQSGWSDDRKKAQAECVALVLAALKTDGYTDAAMAGVCANMKFESHFDPYAWEGYSDYFDHYIAKDKKFTRENKGTYGGAGLIQWTYGRHTDLSNYCQSADKDSAVVTGQYYTAEGVKSAADAKTYMGSAGTQTAFLLKENKWNSGSKNKAWVKAAGYEYVDGFANLKKLKNAKQASANYTCCVEVPGNTVSAAQTRAATADQWLSLIQHTDIGSVGKSSSSSTESEKLKSQMDGYWTEEQLSTYDRLIEGYISFKDVDIEHLGQDEVSSIANWKDNIDYMNEDKSIFSIVRLLAMIFGILLEFWGLLFYIAYWFDRINTFVPINLMSLLSFGNLSIAFDDLDANYHLAGENKGHKQLTHRQVLWVSGIALFFGTLFISGLMFKFILGIVTLIPKLLKTLGIM